MRILLVDDDPIARDHLAQTLQAQGHEVLLLESPQGAAALVDKRSIDAVVVDVSFSDMSGEAVVRTLRNSSRGADLGIVLVSARSTRDQRALKGRSGADAVVTKTEVDSELMTQVTNARRRRRSTYRPGRLRA